MTNILALDASTEVCSVALLSDGHLLERRSDTPRSHADQLLPMVDNLLAETGLALRDIDAIAFGAGPGSFTGLRICLGVVQGLAFAGGLPVVAISSLRAMAYSIREQLPEMRCFAPVIDARMKEVYWAVYDAEPSAVSTDGFAVRVEPRVSAVADADQQLIRHLKDLPSAGVGSGWPLLSGAAEVLQACHQQYWPSASAIAKLGESAFLRGEYTTAELAEPVYLRTEISWKKRERIRS